MTSTNLKRPKMVTSPADSVNMPAAHAADEAVDQI